MYKLDLLCVVRPKDLSSELRFTLWLGELLPNNRRPILQSTKTQNHITVPTLRISVQVPRYKDKSATLFHSSYHLVLLQRRHPRMLLLVYSLERDWTTHLIGAFLRTWCWSWQWWYYSYSPPSRHKHQLRTDNFDTPRHLGFLHIPVIFHWIIFDLLNPQEWSYPCVYIDTHTCCSLFPSP